MRWTLAIAVLAACSSDGGAGTNLETVTTLPVADDYALGFEADGTPLLGFLLEQPLLRFDGASWVPHAATTPFRVSGFGLDQDGATLVLHRIDGASTQVYRLEPSGAATPLGAPVQGTFQQVFQHTTGSRFLISNGSGTWILRPGAAAWQRLMTLLFGVRRGPDGQFYAHSVSGVQRFEPNDTTTLVVSCSFAICNNPQYGIDAGGRFFFNDIMSAVAVDPVTLASEEVPMPAGHVLHALGVSSRQTIVVALRFDGEDGTLGARQVLAFTPGEDGLALVGVHQEHVLDDREVRIHVDPQDNLYMTQGDWLGRVEVAR